MIGRLLYSLAVVSVFVWGFFCAIGITTNHFIPQNSIDVARGLTGCLSIILLWVLFNVALAILQVWVYWVRNGNSRTSRIKKPTGGGLV